MSMASTNRSSITDRLAAGPISWGVCEVPGWGLQLDPDRVLSEMRSLGIAATEAGPDGYLGSDVDSVQTLLDRHGIQLVGGFLPVVLHEPSQLEASLEKVRRTAKLFAALGAQFINSAAVVDDDWSPRIELSAQQWDHLLRALPLVDEVAAEHGVRHALHPHWGTVIERDVDVQHVLDGSDVEICLDTGHLALGGTDPLRLARDHADRVSHVHLKDVSEHVAARLRAGELALVPAVQAGLFQPLGQGDVDVDEIVLTLERAGYTGWYVLEQDTAILENVPSPGQGPVDEVRHSIEFLQAIAHGGAPIAATSEGR
jgi:inosose dehydratase